jgi:hypothetical protein
VLRTYERLNETAWADDAGRSHTGEVGVLVLYRHTVTLTQACRLCKQVSISQIAASVQHVEYEFVVDAAHVSVKKHIRFINAFDTTVREYPQGVATPPTV